MKFKVLLHKKADKFLRELKPEEKKRIIDKLRQLEIVKIAGEENTFRLRVGNYRALFKVYEQERIIVIIKLDIRKEFTTEYTGKIVEVSVMKQFCKPQQSLSAIIRKS